MIEIAASYDHERNARISVSDNGIGIARKDHERIFELFKQLRAGSGTGIGLSLVQRIVDGLGGVTSDGSSGSTFTVSLAAAPQSR